MRVGYVNKIDETTLTASSEYPGYPIENLQDSRMSRTWKPLLVGSSWIKPSGQITATFAVINAHNFTSGDTVTLKGYTDAARTSLDTTITFDLIEYGTAEIFTEKTLYWTFEFSSTNIIEIGGIFLGDHIILPHYEIGHEEGEYTKEQVELSYSQQLYGENAVNYRKANFLLPFVDIDTEAVTLKTLWRTVGKFKAFYLLKYPDRQDRSRVYYCRFTMEYLKLQEHEKNINMVKDVPIQIEEIY